MWVLFALPTASDEVGGGPSSWQCVEENDYFVLQVRQKGAPSSSYYSSLSHRSSRRLGDGLVRVATLFSSSRSKGSTLVDPLQGGPIEYRIVLKASLADRGGRGDQPAKDDGQPPADEEREEAEKKKNKKLLDVADADMEAGHGPVVEEAAVVEERREGWEARVVAEGREVKEAREEWRWLEANVVVACSFFNRKSAVEERELFHFLMLKFTALAEEAQQHRNKERALALRRHRDIGLASLFDARRRRSSSSSSSSTTSTSALPAKHSSGSLRRSRNQASSSADFLQPIASTSSSSVSLGLANRGRTAAASAFSRSHSADTPSTAGSSSSSRSGPLDAIMGSLGDGGGGSSSLARSDSVDRMEVDAGLAAAATAKAEGEDEDEDEEALLQRVGRDYEEQDKALQAAWRKAFPKLASLNEKAIACTAPPSLSCGLYFLFFIFFWVSSTSRTDGFFFTTQNKTHTAL